jgi:threonine/homoserine/homoserine lactone efflux protein
MGALRRCGVGNRLSQMSWSSYGGYLAFAAVLVVVPGPDFAVVTKNTLVAGRRRGRWTALGVGASNAVQGTAAAFGLGALIIRVQPLFEAIKWAGVAYLAFLGVQALRSALRGRYVPLGTADNASGVRFQGWRQGFLSNITNPKVLVFYLAVMPQFLSRGSGIGWIFAFAWSHALLSLGYLMLLTTGLHGARRALDRRTVRRALDATTGAVLLGFSVRLATERV